MQWGMGARRAGKRAPARWWLARGLLMAAMVLGLSACYEVELEVYSAKEAVIIPGLPGRYESDLNTYVVTQVQGSNEYSFTDPRRPEAVPGRFRAVPLGHDLYMMQLRPGPDQPNTFWYLVFRVERTNNAVVRVTKLLPEYQSASALAQRLGVQLQPQTALEPDIVRGGRAQVASFIRAFATLPLKSDEELRRVR